MSPEPKIHATFSLKSPLVHLLTVPGNGLAKSGIRTQAAVVEVRGRSDGRGSLSPVLILEKLNVFYNLLNCN